MGISLVGIGSADFNDIKFIIAALQSTIRASLAKNMLRVITMCMCVCGVFSDLLDAVDATLISLGDEQRAQVGQSDGLGSLQGGTYCCPAHKVVVNTWNLAMDGTSRHNTHLEAF